MTPDQRLITRTWRRIWWQTSSVVAVAVLAVAGTAAGLVLTTQHDAARNTVESTMEQAVADPGGVDRLSRPVGVWVFAVRGDEILASAGAPARPVDEPAVSAASAGAPLSDGRPHETHHGRHEYLVDTRQVGEVTIQVALDLTAQEDEQHRLYVSLAAAGAVGLALAAGAGALIARRAIRPLGVALQRQQRFVADASHELRTPITQLHTRAQMLARTLSQREGDSDAAQDARHLVHGTRLMGDIVEEMLLAAQLRTEPDQFGPVQLGAIVADVIEAYAGRARELPVAFELIVEPGDHVVRGVPGALRRAVAALVDNALGHVHPHGHVVVTLAADRGWVVCSVRDDGVGFDPADSQRMFERFARGTHGQGRRFGLGLALVRETVAAHGGSVDAAGEPGAGATFTIRLPPWDRGQPGQPAHSSV